MSTRVNGVQDREDQLRQRMNGGWWMCLAFSGCWIFRRFRYWSSAAWKVHQLLPCWCAWCILSFLVFFMFLRSDATSSDHGREARFSSHGGVSEADQCVHGHSFREYAAVFGHLWWPGDALQLGPARGDRARSLCRWMHPSKASIILSRWCCGCICAGNRVHHGGSMVPWMGYILVCVLWKAWLQSSAAAMDPSSHVFCGQLLFSESYDVCAASGVDGIFEFHGICKGCDVCVVHLQDWWCPLFRGSSCPTQHPGDNSRARAFQVWHRFVIKRQKIPEACVNGLKGRHFFVCFLSWACILIWWVVSTYYLSIEIYIYIYLFIYDLPMKYLALTEQPCSEQWGWLLILFKRVETTN